MIHTEVLKPACFNHFSCKGGDCRNTCCANWGIPFSAKDRKAMLKKPKDLAESIHLLDASKQSGENIYAITLDESNQCPFLSEQKLCIMQQRYGEKIIPAVCREFPRIYHNYLNKSELALSLGCEKVLELLYEEKNGLHFMNGMETLPNYQRPVSNIGSKERLKYPGLIYYYDIQSLCIGFLQAEDAAIEDRIVLLGMALFHIDTLVKNGEHLQIPSYINKFINDMENINAAGEIKGITTEHVGALCSNLLTILEFTKEENITDIHIRKLADQITQKIKLKIKTPEAKNSVMLNSPVFECSLENYRQCQESFRIFIKDKEYFMENLAVASMFYFNSPFYEPKNGIWKDFTYFIWIFTMVKFAMTVVLDEKSTVEDMIDCCAVMFRMLGHNRKLYQSVVENLEESQSNSVAHMAILLKSC